MGERFIPLDEILTSPFNSNRFEKIDINDTEGKEAAEFLQRTGLMTGPVIQIDIAAARRYISPTVVFDKALCDHNCSLKGGYNCNARNRLPENKGLKRKDLAPAGKIVEGILISAAGIIEFNKRFVTNGSLDVYCQEFNIPDYIKKGMQLNLQRTDVMVNLFGGNAEMHPQALQIAKECHTAGLRTTLTTTGGVLLRDNPESESFLFELCDGRVDILAVSGEFKNLSHIKRLEKMTKLELYEEWKAVDPEMGQLRKGIEAMNAIHLQKIYKDKFPQLLLNIVVSQQILGSNGEVIEGILETLKEIAPHALLNPYPAQSFRKGKEDELSFSPEDIPSLQNFITNRRIEQRNRDPHMALRPHYYDMLEAVLRTYKDNPISICERFSGEHTWKCFENRHGISGAGGVFQVGASPFQRNVSEFPHPGGFPACFWNETTITNSKRQVWNMTPTEVADYMDTGMQQIAQEVSVQCNGCDMPRLNGDKWNLALGLEPALKPNFIGARSESVGF